MSFTDPAAEVTQPEGQGDAGTSDAPYAEYLNRIPEEVRGEVEPVFKDWDSNVTRRFQEASEYRKQWEPYEPLGLNRLSPDEVAWALQFRQAAVENPQAVKEWFDGYAKERGLVEQAAAQPAPAEDPYAYQDPQQQFERLLEERLSPLQQKVEQYEQRWAAQQEQEALAYGQSVIDQQFADLKAKHPDQFTPEAQDWVEARAAAKYLDDAENAIPRAWGDYQALVNQVEKQVLQAKVDAPAPAETGGVPDVTPEKFTRIDDERTKTAAVEFLRNSNRLQVG